MTAHRAAFDLFRLSEAEDPGASETIRVDRNPCSVPLVSAAAETRTLARPTRAGTLLNLYMRTDDGDITLTVTGGYNEDGDTTFTFSDAGQFLMLVSCYDGTNYYWRKVADHQTGNVSPTETGYLSGVTAGTVTASKAVVVDADKDVESFRDVTARTLNLGTAGSIIGTLTLSGSTSGTITIVPAAVAGTYSLTLPADDGDAGEQLQTDGSGVLTWEAAGSLRSVKNLIADLTDKAPLALERVLGAKVYAFRYKEGGRPTSGDYKTVYHGVLAEEYPQVMHHGGRIFNPVSAFGELVLAVQAVSRRLTALEKANEYGTKATPDTGDRVG